MLLFVQSVAMTSRRSLGRRSVAVLALAASVVALAGCDMAKAGARCRAGAAPARDATHVLFCRGGKWTRVMTIGQAADIIVASWPTKIELVDGGGQTAGIGDAFGTVVVKVTKKDGSPAKGAEVDFAGPATGASIAASGPAVTDADGLARITLVANNVIGGYPVTAIVRGAVKPYVTFGLNNAAGAAAGMVVVSGNDQTATAGTQFANPIVVRAVDRFGNTVTNTNVEFSSPAVGVWFGPSTSYAGDDGRAQTTMGTGNVAGDIPVTARVVGTNATVTFNMHVVPGPAVESNFVKGAGEGESAQASARFSNPLVVAFSDMFGNGVAGQTVTWTVVDGGPGTASGTLEVFPSDANGLAKVWITGNGVPGTFQVTAQAFTTTHTFNVTLTA